VFASRFGGTPIVGYRKMWLRIANLRNLPADITPHVPRHSFASLAADLGYNEPTIATLLGHKALPAATSIPPMRCCWPQPMPWPVPP
jgi:integrase